MICFRPYLKNRKHVEREGIKITSLTIALITGANARILSMLAPQTRAELHSMSAIALQTSADAHILSTFTPQTRAELHILGATALQTPQMCTF